MVWTLFSIRPCKNGLISIPLQGLVFCDNTVPTISDIFSNADDLLFKTILKNSYVLYPYLPENQYQHYRLKQRPHNKALIPKTTYLSNRDCIRRKLYKNCYSPTVIPCCDTVITHCACVCCCRDVWPFICFTVAICVLLAYIVFSFVKF